MTPLPRVPCIAIFSGNILRGIFRVLPVLMLAFPGFATPPEGMSDSAASLTTGTLQDTTPAADTLNLQSTTDSPSNADTLPVSGPTVAAPSLSSPENPAVMQKQSIPKHVSDSSTNDTTGIKNGSYLSAGFGWSLGGFTLLNLWENAIPDSLGSFGLSIDAFSIPFDSTAAGTGQQVDTADLTFSFKEKPASYTMCFPVSVSLIRMKENDRYAFSLSGSWMRKLCTATIAASGDSLSRKVDFREQMNVFSLYLSFVYGRRIPHEFFLIQESDRSYFTVAIDIAPQILCAIRRDVTASASDVRFENIRNAVASPSRRLLHGSAAALRLGLNIVKRLNAYSATDFGLLYSIQGYGCFLENGDRVTFDAVDPSSGKKGKTLYWVSNRLEISIAVLRLRKKK